MNEELLAWVDGLDHHRHYLQPWNVQYVSTAMVPRETAIPTPPPPVLGVVVHFVGGGELEGYGNAADVERDVQHAIHGLSPGDV